MTGTDQRAVVPWLLSAESDTSLRAAAARLHGFVASLPSLDPPRLARGLARGPALAHRAVLVGSGREEFLAGLAALAAGEQARNLTQAGPVEPGGVVFVFPGQGSQWPGMGRDLYAASPVFRTHLDACADALGSYVDWSLHDVLTTPDPTPFARTDVVQPALFAMMVALAGLWRSYGVEPDAVVGHSQGEIAAAHVAGALSLADAARIVALRSQALSELSDTGGMVSVSLPAAELASRIAPWSRHIAVAVVNSPGSTVVAGETEALAELEASLLGSAEEVTVRKVNVDYASHSPAVERIEARLSRDLAGVRARQARTPFYSTVTGGLLADTSVLGTEYWYRNLRQTVHFEQATRALWADGHGTYVETSPHPILAPAIANTLREQDPTVIATSRKYDGDQSRFLTAVAKAHTHGVRVDWTSALDDPVPGLAGRPA
ncbi:acyltransferase domain-containing protein [Actinophytocola oryzae]|uniref:Acyl transferase family protein n=1 Tax=Actinophytocola oryzae TaxID=502181 RepID=A0A4R7VKC6_9PSEU|nr:acyltransferase domain-containing protein [Actinophytocola oryzae]TDV49924.1 acyl transferase family protein [Actinophytocola oryzae]